MSSEESAGGRRRSKRGKGRRADVRGAGETGIHAGRQTLDFPATSEESSSSLPWGYLQCRLHCILLITAAHLQVVGPSVVRAGHCLAILRRLRLHSSDYCCSPPGSWDPCGTSRPLPCPGWLPWCPPLASPPRSPERRHSR